MHEELEHVGGELDVVVTRDSTQNEVCGRDSRRTDHSQRSSENVTRISGT